MPLRAAFYVLIGLVLIASGGTTWFYWIARQSLPQVDGQIAVAGLSAPVKVLRDAQGVPHIIAANAEDLFFAQGYVTAQDRLWQMDLSRRLAAGTTAEVLGEAVLGHDQGQRIIGIPQEAERSWQAMPETDRAHFEAYARGVNAYMEAHRDRLPVEFRVLRYSPKPWTAIDSMLCGILMTEGLDHGLFYTKLMHEEFVERLGPKLAADLFPNSSWRDHPPGVDQKAAIRNQIVFSGVHSRVAVAEPVSDPALSPIPDDGLAPGSNNWVISGAHTVTGKPLLSNDMHLVLRIPNTWYESHLEIRSNGGEPGFDVVGFTLPGLPYVLVGHNQRIAWGFTNLVPDVEDLFIENVRSDGEYQTPNGWKAMTKRREVIHVKGKPDVVFDVMFTRHGPVITDLVPNEKRTLALQWSISDGPVSVPFFDLDAARNWQEFRTALSHFTAPGLNVVYADSDGNVGYQAIGRIPIRRSGNGSLPVSGVDDAHEWTGYIPFDKMPSVYDPPSGVIATANGRVTPGQYPYSISTQWASPYRTERIYHVLNSGKKFTPEDMLRLQTDTYSVFDRFCAKRFAAAVNHSSQASARALQAAQLMGNWNGWVSPDMAAPTLIAQARRELLHLLLAPKLQAKDGQSGVNDIDWTDYHWFMSSVALEKILIQQPKRWLPARFATYDDLLTAAVENAVKEKDAPADLTTWKWAQQTALAVQHPIFGKVPVLKHWSGPGRLPQAGDGYTVKQTGSRTGPSERMTVDLANLDNSIFNVNTGQSGQIFSPHYMDQFQAWYQGFSFPMPFSNQAVSKAKVNELTLVPR